jgi:hypothetical protein
MTYPFAATEAAANGALAAPADVAPLAEPAGADAAPGAGGRFSVTLIAKSNILR